MKKEEIKITKSLLQDAREAFVNANTKEDTLFEILEHFGVDFDEPTNAENASNLGEAISCFLQYGEYNIKGLLKEIEKAKKDIW